MTRNEYLTQVNSDALKYLPFKVIPGLSGILVIYILTSQLPLEDYGKYSFILVTILLIAQFTGTWINNAVLYVYPKYYETESDLFKNNIILFQILLLIPGTLICCIIFYFLTHNIFIAILATTLLIYQVFNSLIYSFMRSLRVVTLQTNSILIQVIIHLILLIILLVFVKKDLTIALVAIVSSYLFSFIYILRKSQLSLGKLFRSLNKDIINYKGIQEVIHYGLPLALWFFSTQLFTLGDRIILNFYHLDKDLGIYASYRDLLTGGFSFFTMPLLLASHPIIMRMWSKNVESIKIEHILSENLTLIFLFFVPALMFINEFGATIFLSWMNYEYFDKAVVSLIILSVMTSAIGIYAQKGLEVAGNTILMAKVSLFVVIISIGLNFLAVGIWGIIGMAIVNLISQVLYLSIVYYFARSSLKIRITSFSILYVFIFCVLIKVFLISFPNMIPVINMLIYISVLFILFLLLPETRFFINNMFGMFKKQV